MDTIENPVALVRQMKGAPISVLFALMLVRQPVSTAWLVGVTGYSDHPVKTALDYLVELQMVQRNRRYNGWWLTDKARQLPLGSELLVAGTVENAVPATTTTTAAIEARILPREAAAASTGTAVNAVRSHNRDEVIHILSTVGIGEPMASKLASLPHVNKTYLEYHIEKAKKENILTGLLIHRIRSADPVVHKESWNDYAYKCD